MRTMKMFILGCVVVLLVAGVVSFPKTAFGLEIVVGCAGPPSVTGSTTVSFTMADGRQMNLPAGCSSEWGRHGSTSNNTISSAQVTGWTVTQMSVNGANCMDDITTSGTTLPARLTCKHPTENVRLHVTVK